MSKRSREEKRTAWRQTMRVVAVAFLVLACADLSFPQICGEDNEPLFPTQRIAATPTLIDARDADDAQSHPTRTEDCFCCCSHILSAQFSPALAELAAVSGTDRAPAPTVPLPLVQVLFHPPRLA